jgi:hypothetical protein
LLPARVLTGPADAFAERAFAGPEVLRRRLVDDHDRGPVGGVGGGEGAAFEEANPVGGEVIG